VNNHAAAFKLEQLQLALSQLLDKQQLSYAKLLLQNRPDVFNIAILWPEVTGALTLPSALNGTQKSILDAMLQEKLEEVPAYPYQEAKECLDLMLIPEAKLNEA